LLPPPPPSPPLFPYTTLFRSRDPWLNILGTVEAGKVWAGGDDPTQPRLSPINGELGGLAPMDVYVGTHELCLPDVLLLQERGARSEEHTSELQSRFDLVCRLL